MTFRKYLSNNLNWSIYSIDETCGVLRTEFLRDDYGIFYNVERPKETIEEKLLKAKEKILDDIISELVENLESEQIFNGKRIRVEVI